MYGFSAKCAGLLFVLLLAACFPQSKNPISDAGKAVIDTRLNGTWTATMDDELSYIHFLAKEDNMTDIVMINFREKGAGSGEWMLFSMFPSRIGDTKYMNIKFVAQSGKLEPEGNENFFLMRYQISPEGKLIVWAMKESAVIDAIKNGLKGTVRLGKYFNDVLITASQGELVKFLGESDSKVLFGKKFGTFHRLH